MDVVHVAVMELASVMPLTLAHTAAPVRVPASVWRTATLTLSVHSVPLTLLNLMP